MNSKLVFTCLRKSHIFSNSHQRTFASAIKFTKSHEYIKLDGDIGTIGITDHAAAALGDIVYVDLPSKGTKIFLFFTFNPFEGNYLLYASCIILWYQGNKYSAGDSFGSVESVKAASDVYCPVAGEVIESNTVSLLLLCMCIHGYFNSACNVGVRVNSG